jgi:hypothetical protein
MTDTFSSAPPINTQYHRTDNNRVRFKIPRTKTYLHLSGAGTTEGTAYAWSGTKEQAKKLRDRAKIRGEDWPFTAVRFTSEHNTREDIAA